VIRRRAPPVTAGPPPWQIWNCAGAVAALAVLSNSRPEASNQNLLAKEPAEPPIEVKVYEDGTEGPARSATSGGVAPVSNAALRSLPVDKHRPA